MARESISKIAYKTLQQSKSIAGFAHKQISSRLMNFILPDSKLENFDIDKDLLMRIQNSMEILREEDWNDAEKNIYPKKLLFDEPWLRYLSHGSSNNNFFGYIFFSASFQSSSLKISIEFWIRIRRSLSISKFSSFESGRIKFINLELICL